MAIAIASRKATQHSMETASQVSSSGPDKDVDRGYRCFQDGQYEAAIKHFSSALERYSSHTYTTGLQPQWIVACNAVFPSLAQCPCYTTSCCSYLLVLCQFNYSENNTVPWEPHRRSEQRSAATCCKLAEAYLKTGSAEEAAAAAAEAVQLRPRWPDAHCQLGLAQAALGQHASAIKALR